MPALIVKIRSMFLSHLNIPKEPIILTHLPMDHPGLPPDLDYWDHSIAGGGHVGSMTYEQVGVSWSCRRYDIWVGRMASVGGACRQDREHGGGMWAGQ